CRSGASAEPGNATRLAFADWTKALRVFPAQKPRQRMLKHLTRIAAGMARTPGDKSVGADQRCTIGRMPISAGEAIFRIAQLLPKRIGLKRDAEVFRRFTRRCAPDFAVRRRQEREAATEQIERRDALAVLLDPQMGSARAGPSTGRLRIGVDRRVIVLRSNGLRVIEITELDIEIVDLRLEVLCAEISGRARDVARIGLLDGEFADRAALLLIRV